MNRYMLKQYGIHTSTPDLEPACARPPFLLPKDHPCYGCIVLDTRTGVPYCFLPRCDRALFDMNKEDQSNA